MLDDEPVPAPAVACGDSGFLLAPSDLDLRCWDTTRSFCPAGPVPCNPIAGRRTASAAAANPAAPTECLLGGAGLASHQNMRAAGCCRHRQ